MSKNAEIILEGTYQYSEKETNYSHENFKLVHHPDDQSYHVYAEVLSRIETGEFLKILVRYEMNSHFLPQFVRIEKSIGNKYALETYSIDSTDLELTYTFQNSQGSQEFKRNVSAKHYISAPAVSTSALFTLSKKFDATGRTAVNFISSDNEWSYNGPPTEKIVYADYSPRELPDYKVRGNELAASLLSLYEHDATHAGLEEPVEIYLSKHFSIPYQLVQGEMNVIVTKLKKNTL